MKHGIFVALLALPALLAGCTHINVSSDSAPSYDFSRIGSYQWSEPPAELLETGEAYVDLQMQQALNNELAAMGWKEVLEASGSSIQAAYWIDIKSHSEFSANAPDSNRDFSGGLVFNRDQGDWNYEEREPNRTEYVVETGTFHLLLFDAANGEAIWHGIVQAELDRSLPPEEQKERFVQIAGKLSRALYDDSR